MPVVRITILWVVVAAACGREARAPGIGFASNLGWPNAATLAGQVMREGADPRTAGIRIDGGDSALEARSGDGLASEVDRALQLSADLRIIGVVGPGGSRQALQTAPIYRDAGLPNIVPTSTSRRLRAAGPWTFTMAPDDSLQGEFIGAFVAERFRARAPLLFYLPDEYGVGLASGTAAALERRGIHLLGRIPIRQTACLPTEPNPYDEVAGAAARRGTPDVVLLAARTGEAACLIRALQHQAGPLRYLAGDGTLPAANFVDLAGQGADSLYVVAFWHPDRDDPASRAFVTRFRTLVGRTPRHDDAMFYDATLLFAAAVRAVGPERGKIRDYLAELGRSIPPYEGVSGPIAFTPDAPRPLMMTRFRAGRTEVVTPP